MSQSMTRDNSMSPRGLLSRRGMMRGSLVAAGSAVVPSLAVVEEAKAEADIPIKIWRLHMGSRARRCRNCAGQSRQTACTSRFTTAGAPGLILSNTG
jgi:hypothetical protein